MTLVTLGNGWQPFPRLVEAIKGVIHLLPRPVIVQAGHTPCSSSEFEVRMFFENEEFLRILGKAALVISHAGAGTIIHAVCTGHLPIVMPRLARHGEIIDDHQLELAEALGRAGKVIHVYHSADLGLAISRALAFASTDIKPVVPRLPSLVTRCLDQYGHRTARD